MRPLRPMSGDEIRGLEYDWLAVDPAGHVALFSTAGGGWAPAEFLLDPEAHDDAIEELLALPSRAGAALAPSFGGTWLAAAERGLYAFDSDPHGAPYALVAAPLLPVHVSELPNGVRRVAERIVLSGHDFARAAAQPR